MQQFPLKSVEDYKMIMAHTTKRSTYSIDFQAPHRENPQRKRKNNTLELAHYIKIKQSYP